MGSGLRAALVRVSAGALGSRCRRRGQARPGSRRCRSDQTSGHDAAGFWTPTSRASSTKLTTTPSFRRSPVFRRVIAGWLKAGVFTGEVFDPTEMGTPQGGVISPLLANIALHGLEDLFHEWSLVGGKRFVCETVETFSAPPQGYRKCQAGERREQSARAAASPARPTASNHRRFTGRIPTEAGGPCDWSSTTSEHGPTRHSARIRTSATCG